MVADEYEILRDQYRPGRTRTLFVGESRPTSGKFFYRGDSTLEQYTQEAFGFEGSTAEFLDYFKVNGCYLVDLCVDPVNGLTPVERRTKCREGEVGLADAIKSASPEVIIVVMKGIGPNVRRAIDQAGMKDVPVHVLPFPAMSHEREYVRRLRTVLGELRAAGGLSAAPMGRGHGLAP